MTITIDLPETIHYDQVAAAMKALGIPEDARITGIYMDPTTVDIRGITPDGTEYGHRYLVTPRSKRAAP